MNRLFSSQNLSPIFGRQSIETQTEVQIWTTAEAKKNRRKNIDKINRYLGIRIMMTTLSTKQKQFFKRSCAPS